MLAHQLSEKRGGGGESISFSRREDSKVGYEENVDSYGKERHTLSLKPVDRGSGRNLSAGETGPRSFRNRSVEPVRSRRETHFENAETQTDDSSSESGRESKGIGVSEVVPENSNIDTKEVLIQTDAALEEEMIEVNQLQSVSKYKLPIELNGKPVEAVVDTGADVTIISEELFNSMKRKP
ncbi:hypothetical protein DPMN_176802 [Dreissena polymorpha]|uniref:Peptidase A2 domain-containing protein n=1 Tax=Dreissena polymorpha TaxID=45954 RepID=A0A9D4IIE5_DREPO|nr:hypothetical protein DPMN_176802 [Dreissena polymorpha]